MKTEILSWKRVGLFFFLPLFSMLFLVACSKSDNDDMNNGNGQEFTTQGNAQGSQQNPPVTTNGTATLVGSYNTSTNKWDYSVSWSSLTGAATIIEFHGPADVGLNGDILFAVNISAGGSNGATSGTVTLTDQQESYLLNGRIYYTIVTTAHLTGEVRGQVYVLSR